MKKVLALTLLNTLVILTCSSQNYIYKGNNKYKSTSSWNFKINGNFWANEVELCVAKHKDGGYLMMSIGVPFNHISFKGTVTLFLNDGSFIKCLDRGIDDHVDNKSVALFNLTLSEIESLKENIITKVRFSLIGLGEGIETFTADNRIDYNSIFNLNEKDYYETNLGIKELFE